ncbi:MAG: hypothetical protein FWD90_05135 [Defluviitaleaceae bacterium]|nr:hypothetical protein [Defluviitaleaceae bacterium]
MKNFYKIIIGIAIALLMTIAFASWVYAVPYHTWTRSGNTFVMTQTAYEPYFTLSHIGPYALNTPSDLRIGSDGLMYIADTGNARILVATLEGEWVRTIGEGILQTPRGVFRADYGRIYVADQGAQAVFVFNDDNELLQTITRPVHPLFGRTAPFFPMKVVADLRGNAYIISQGNFNGIIQLAGGTHEFLGYFGANTTNVTWFTAFRRWFYTEEQMVRLTGINPITVTNIAVDSRGLVHSVSSGDADGLKRLNMAGTDILNIEPGWNSPAFVAVAAAENGNIVAATHQWIYEYTPEGDLLFVFGGSGLGLRQRAGLFQSISAVAMHEGRMYVVDDMLSIVQVMTRTEFAQNVHTAFDLFNAGMYVESMEPWREIIRMNAMFAYAGVGLGEAYFRVGDFSNALRFFRRGYDVEGYSDAFWELRSNWMQANLGTFIVAAFILIVLWQTLKFADRKYIPVLMPLRKARDKIKGFTLFSQCAFSLRNITNPAAAAEGIKYDGKGSYKAAFILLFIFYVLFILERYFSGFLFRTVEEGQYDLLTDAAVLLAAVLLPIICCYLVTAITDGEATFKQLFVGIIYAFAPLFVLKPVVVIMTNVLTLNEAFFITFTNFVAYVWTALLIFLAIKNLNDYTFGKTIKTLIMALFVTLITAMLIFIIYVLVMQVADFGTGFTREAVFRLVRR